MNEGLTVQNHSKHNIKAVLIVGLFSFTVFVSCLLANVIQLINYLTIRLVNIHCYRYINYFLQYIIYSQVVAICEWWAGCTITAYYSDEETKRLFGKEHSIGVANHRYEVDAAYLWMAATKVNALGGCKAFGKKELKFVPIIGWTFFFGEYIFLERNWSKDSKNIGSGLDRLMAHRNPVMIMIAAEGTRFTPEKYNTSMKFSVDKGLGVHYKHHLLPRVKGFAASVKHLKENYPNSVIHNLQLAFDESCQSGVSVSNLIKGIPMNGSIYIQRIPISAIPTDSEEEIANYLYELYSEKDRLMDYFNRNLKFPGIPVPYKASLLPAIVLWINFVLVGVPFTYLLFKVFTSGNIFVISMTSIFIIIVYISLYIAIRSAKINKGSTYGTIEDKNSNSKLNNYNKPVVNGKTSNLKDE